jgi:hypothetical protein
MKHMHEDNDRILRIGKFRILLIWHNFDPEKAQGSWKEASFAWG